MKSFETHFPYDIHGSLMFPKYVGGIAVEKYNARVKAAIVRTFCFLGGFTNVTACLTCPITSTSFVFNQTNRLLSIGVGQLQLRSFSCLAR